jgi:hypothetical protein
MDEEDQIKGPNEEANKQAEANRSLNGRKIRLLLR